MHDPMVVAFDIPRPWPSRNKHLIGDARSLGVASTGPLLLLAVVLAHLAGVATTRLDVPDRDDAGGGSRASSGRPDGTCVCLEPIFDNDLSGVAYGVCARCEKRRAWRSPDRPDGIRATRILAAIPSGKRDKHATAEATRIWTELRETPAASRD